MTLQECKNFLKVDFDDDDRFINDLMISSEIYLYNATGKIIEGEDLDFTISGNTEKVYFAESQLILADLYRYALIYEMYENRSLTSDKAGQKINHIYSSILQQLRYS